MKRKAVSLPARGPGRITLVDTKKLYCKPWPPFLTANEKTDLV